MSAPPRLRFHPFGIELEEGLLWLDSRRAKPFGLVTHAHADHVGRHQTTLCTPETGALVRKRTGSGRTFLERRYGEPTMVGDLKVTLLPAGHVLGSAMALVEGPGGSLLYTGDVRLRGGLTCPPAETAPADVLVMEATFGTPAYRLPDPDEVREAMVRFARDSLAAGDTPVFLAYALGKAQEVMALLSREKVPIAAHGSVWRVCDVYRGFGFAFPGSRRLAGKDGRNAAVVVPRHFLKDVRGGERLRCAAVTGWGERALQWGVERVFPLSDHDDYDGLLELVERVRPKKIHVLHGYARTFAADLRARGYDAEPVPGHSGPGEDGQLELQLDPA